MGLASAMKSSILGAPAAVPALLYDAAPRAGRLQGGFGRCSRPNIGRTGSEFLEYTHRVGPCRRFRLP